MPRSAFLPPVPASVGQSASLPKGSSTRQPQRFTLDNGLEVYLLEDHRAPLVAVQLWYHVGSSDEPTGRSGLSHYLEHLVFKGSAKLPAGHYTRTLSRLGADWNAFTYEDATVFHATLPSSRMEVMLEAMADSMVTATLAPTQWTTERAVVLNERRAQIDENPVALALERANRLAHGTSAYASPVIGHQDDLEQLDLAAVRDWYETWYHPNNATLVVAGHTDLTSVRAMVERHFAHLPAGSLPERTTPRHEVTAEGRTQTVTLPGLRPGLIMSFNVPGMATADVPEQAMALSLLTELLGNGKGSRLYTRLVLEEGVLQALSVAYRSLMRGDSLLTISAFSNPDNATPEQAAARIVEVIETLDTVPPTPAELSRAKARQLAARVYAQDALDEQARLIGLRVVAGLDPLDHTAETTLIARLQGETLRAVAQRYLTCERRTLTYLLTKETDHE